MDDEVRRAQKNLSERDYQIYRDELKSHQKSVGVTYLLWLFTGLFGGHKFYLGEHFSGLCYLVLSAVGIIIPLFFLLPGIGCFIDLFTIPGQIRKRTKKEAKKLLKDFENEE